MEDEWISLRDLWRLAQAREIPAQFDAPLREYLKGGLITCKVKNAALRKELGQVTPRYETNWIAPSAVWKGRPDNSGFSTQGVGSYWIKGGPTGFFAAELTGLSFNKQQVWDCFQLSGELTPKDHTAARPAPRSGAKVNAKQWELFAAALVTLWHNDEIDLTNVKATRDKVADFLAKKGYEETLSRDTVAPLIRRTKAWTDGLLFEGDQAE